MHAYISKDVFKHQRDSFIHLNSLFNDFFGAKAPKWANFTLEMGNHIIKKIAKNSKTGNIEKKLLLTTIASLDWTFTNCSRNHGGKPGHMT